MQLIIIILKDAERVGFHNNINQSSMNNEIEHLSTQYRYLICKDSAKIVFNMFNAFTIKHSLDSLKFVFDSNSDYNYKQHIW